MQIIKMNRKSSKENQLSLVTLSLDLICLWTILKSKYKTVMKTLQIQTRIQKNHRLKLKIKPILLQYKPLKFLKISTNYLVFLKTNIKSQVK